MCTMKLFIQLLIFSFISVSLCDNCDNYGILLYEDLGCTPHFSDTKTCPIKYTCRGLEPSNSKCDFRGKSYNDGEFVEEDLSSPSCNAGCFCRVNEGKARFICAILDCPEWLGLPVGPGCYRKYALDNCCSVGQICPPFNDTEKCVVDGKEYKEGERFYPQNTCWECVCQKGFKGKFEEPFCIRRTCGVQLKRSSDIHNKCAPLYNKKSKGVLCCPSGGWVCPDGSEVIKGEAKKDDVCKFGSKTLKVGQNFEKLNFRTSFGRKFNKITCECVIPPLVMCNEAEEE